MYQLFIDKKSIVFSEPKAKLHYLEDYSVIPASKNKTYNSICKNLKNEPYNTLLIQSEDSKKEFSKCKAAFKNLSAAGGIVKNSKNNYLVIKRLEKWDFPKGKVEANESYKQAAIREVCEECGVDSPKIIKQLPSTHHLYYEKEIGILKTTFWYEMFLHNTNQPLTPQTTEGITEVTWMNKVQMSETFLNNTYSSLSFLWNEFIKNDG